MTQTLNTLGKTVNDIEAALASTSPGADGLVFLPFLNGDNMLLSVLFSVFVCGLAAMNLALDFDFIEKATNAGMPKDYEWVAALGLTVTLVWLYLELLRLLSYMRN